MWAAKANPFSDIVPKHGKINALKVPVSGTPGWDRVRKTVAQVAAKECGEALEAVDDLMRNIDI